MKTNHHFLLLAVSFLLGRVEPDLDPLQDYCVADTRKTPQLFFSNEKPCIDPARASPAHFVTSLTDPANILVVKGSGFNVSQTTIENMPGMNTMGLSLGRVVFAGHGLVGPHSHPRASEVVICLRGSLLVGFVDTSNRLYSEKLKPGESFVFPKGLIHFAFNDHPVDPAHALSGFTSQNPGFQSSSLSTFAASPPIPDRVMTRAFRISDSDLAKIRKNLGGWS